MPASLLDFLAGGLLQPGWLALAVYLLVATQLTIFTAFKAEWLHAAMTGENRKFQFFQSTDSTMCTIARSPLTATTGVCTDMEIFQHHRETGFQNFRISQA